jgi:hypothetical protein
MKKAMKVIYNCNVHVCENKKCNFQFEIAWIKPEDEEYSFICDGESWDYNPKFCPSCGKKFEVKNV